MRGTAKKFIRFIPFRTIVPSLFLLIGDAGHEMCRVEDRFVLERKKNVEK
jgi:hypothetical protein